MVCAHMSLFDIPNHVIATMHEGIRIAIPGIWRFLILYLSGIPRKPSIYFQALRLMVRAHLIFSTMIVAELREEIRIAIPSIVEGLKSRQVRYQSYQSTFTDCGSWYVPICPCLQLMYSSIVVGVDIRIAIPSIVRCLKDSEWYVCQSAIDGLSRIATHGTCLSVPL